MQSGIVIAIVLSGIGCHNECPDASPAAPAFSTIGGAQAQVFPNDYTPSLYSGWHSMGDSGFESSAYASQRGVWRLTIWSFVLGHDPGMATAREIEESVFGRRD